MFSLVKLCLYFKKTYVDTFLAFLSDHKHATKEVFHV